MQKGTFLDLDEDVRAKLQKQFPRLNATQTKDVDRCSVADLYKKAEEFAKEWNCTVDDVEFDHCMDCGYYGDSDFSRAFLSLQTQETDEQYFKRLYVEHDNAIWRDERDFKEFERLQAKFKKVT